MHRILLLATAAAGVALASVEVHGALTPRAAPTEPEPAFSLGFTVDEPRWVLAGTASDLVVTEADPAARVGPGEGWYYRDPPTRRPVAWRLVDATPGVTLTPDGKLQVASSVEHGRRFRVEASVDRAQWLVAGAIAVYTKAGNPLVGTWKESLRIECGTNRRSTPPDAIEEVFFKPSGEFTVTRVPFEGYKDYWGTYALDTTAHTLILHATGGNHVPPDMDGEGHYRLEGQGLLVLDGIWLGTLDKDVVRGCGHVLR